jgi:hypothetical protein
MIHFPNRDDEPSKGTTEEAGVPLRLPFARYQPCTIETPGSQVSIEYFRGCDGLVPNSCIQVHARAPGINGAVTYELETRLLSSHTIGHINSILAKAEQDRTSPHGVANELYQATIQSGVGVWRPLSISPMAPRATFSETLGPIIPSLGTYLRNPHSLGQRYSATKQIEDQFITVTAHLDSKRNLVRIGVGNASYAASNAELYEVPGRLDRSAGYSVEEIQKDLRSVAFAGLTRFAEEGLKSLRTYMATVAQENFVGSRGAETRPITYTKQYPWGSSVHVKVRPESALITVSSRAADAETRKSGAATLYQWRVTSDDSYQGLSAAEALGQVLPELGVLQGDASVRTAIHRLNVLAFRQQLKRASVEGILGSDTAEAVRAIPGVRLSKIRSESLARAEQIANLLRGIDSVQISATPNPGTVTKPQIIRTMEIGVANQAGAGPALHLTAWNAMNNRIHAWFSAETVLQYGGLRKTMVDLAKALQKQAGGNFPWQGRTAFLSLLKHLEDLDPASNWLLEMGDAQFPLSHDIQSHRVIDQVAAPLITLFGQLTRSGRATDSYTTSIGDKELKIVLGEAYHPYGLDLHIRDGILSRVSVIPRVDLPDGTPILAWNQASEFVIRVPVSHLDLNGQGGQVARQIVRHFATLISNDPGTPVQHFRTSDLRRYLRELSGKCPPPV